MVTQAEAHSWVEVYFPGTGWVPFELTAGLPSINCSAEPPQAAIPVPTKPITPPNRVTGTGIGIVGQYVGYILLVMVIVPILIWVIADELYSREFNPRDTAREVYRRMRGYGKLLHLHLEGGETPHEFTTTAAGRIYEITGRGASTLSVTGQSKESKRLSV